MNYLLNRTCIAITVMALGACSGMTQREKDTAVGAGVGAAAGAVLGGGVLGTVGGAVVGGAIGHETSDDKKK